MSNALQVDIVPNTSRPGYKRSSRAGFTPLLESRIGRFAIWRNIGRRLRFAQIDARSRITGFTPLFGLSSSRVAVDATNGNARGDVSARQRRVTGFIPLLVHRLVIAPMRFVRSRATVSLLLDPHKRVTGFTLIEIIVATSLFLVVMTISTGALLSIIDANAKAQSLEVVMNNLNFALESMARNMRIGVNYNCGAQTPLTLVNDCTDTPLDAIAFLRLLPGGSAQIMVYAYDSVAKSITQQLETSPGGPMGSAIKITSDDVVVEDLDFYVIGTEPSTPNPPYDDTQQPRVLIKVRGTAGTKEKLKTKFAIQTTVTMRRTDY